MSGVGPLVESLIVGHEDAALTRSDVLVHLEAEDRHLAECAHRVDNDDRDHHIAAAGDSRCGSRED